MTFSEKLKEVMQDRGINQNQLACLTGIGKSSISQYLSGKNVPTEKRQRDIAVSIGLDEDYFLQDRIEILPPVKVQAKGKGIRTLNPRDVGTLMGKSAITIQKGLQQGVFPWGYAIRTSEHRWSYFINADRFAEYERIELDETE